MRVECGPVERRRACVILGGGEGGRAEREEVIEELWWQQRSCANRRAVLGREGRRWAGVHSPVWPLADAMCRAVFPFSSRASPSGAVPKRSIKDLASSRSP